MIFLNNILVWFSSVIVFILLSIAINNPGFIYFAAPIVLLIVFFAVWQLVGNKIRHHSFWIFLISPLFFVASSVVFLLFPEGLLFRYAFSAMVAILLLIYLHVVFLYFHKKPRYQPHTLENISSYLNVLTIFLLFSGLFNLKLFIAMPFWLLLLIGAVVTGLLMYQLLSVSAIAWRKSWLSILIITSIIVELFLAVGFLPTSVYVNGLIITLAYYMMSGLAHNWLLDIREKKVFRRYAVISIIIFFIIFITAKWI